jgi:hypothetical protein
MADFNDIIDDLRRKDAKQKEARGEAGSEDLSKNTETNYTTPEVLASPRVLTKDTKQLSLIPENIPPALKSHKRWSLWRAEWNEKRGKFDKIPQLASNPDYGLSTAKPEKWVSFDTALEAFDPDKSTGLGFVMTGVVGLVAIDLDKCFGADWALDIITKMGSYTEISPSGNGYRIFVAGWIEKDVQNHKVGIEVYGGNEARFLTVTGHHVEGTPTDLVEVDPALLAELVEKYDVSKDSATVVHTDMPDILDEMFLPSTDKLPLHDGPKQFLLNGEVGDDRSGTLHGTGVALYAAGYTDAEVFSILATNDYALCVALDHRHQDHDRALEYLWKEHCLKAKGKGQSAIASLDEFDDLGPAEVVIKPSRVFNYDITRLTPVEFVVDGFISTGLTVIAGAPGVGKTSLLVPLAAAVAHLYESDLNPVLRRKVIYYSEAAEQVVRCLYGMTKIAPGVKDQAEFDEWLTLVSSTRVNPKALGEMVRQAVAENTVYFNGYPVAPLIVLDTSNANLDLDNENDNAEVGKMIAAIKENLGSGACWLVHHTAKALKRADVTEMSARGAGAFAGDANATGFVFSQDGIDDKRFMWIDKFRFEPDFRELEFKTDVGSELVETAYGTTQTVKYRVGIPAPSSTSARIAEVEEAKEKQQEIKSTEKYIKFSQKIRDAIIKNGEPMTKNNLSNTVRGNKADILLVIGVMLEREELEIVGQSHQKADLIGIGNGSYLSHQVLGDF